MKKIAMFLLITVLLSCAPENTNNHSDVILQTKGNIHGPVKAINTAYKDVVFNPRNKNMKLRTEYSLEGKIETTQFLYVDEENDRFSKITVQYFYDNSALKTVKYLEDGKTLLVTNITSSNDGAYIYQIMYKYIPLADIIDYDGRFLFDLRPFSSILGNTSLFFYRIKLGESGWDAVIQNKNKKELCRIKHEKYDDIQNYFIENVYLKTFKKIELKFVNDNLVQSSHYYMESPQDFGTEDLTVMTKYGYTSFDNYGNWLEGFEETFGVKLKISREIEYY